MKIPLPSIVCMMMLGLFVLWPPVQGEALGLESTASRIVNAPTNTVWLIYPDMNKSHAKPQGVDYPDLDSYSFHVFSLGVVLGMQAHPQQESIDTNKELFNSTTGQPVVSGVNFVFMAPPAVEAQMAYYESSKTAPVYLSGDASNIFWVLANGTLIRETVTPRSSVRLEAPTSLFLLEVFSDSRSNYVFAGYGLTAKGSVAASVFYKGIYPQLNNYTEPWYIYRWSDTNSNGIPDSSDSYSLVASEKSYRIPEFEVPIIVALVSLLIAFTIVKMRPRLVRSD